MVRPNLISTRVDVTACLSALRIRRAQSVPMLAYLFARD